MPLHITTSTRLGPLDDKIAEVADQADQSGQPLRLHFLARLYKGQRSYVVWPHLSWSVEASSIAEVNELHAALLEFFALAAESNLTNLASDLRGMRAKQAVP